MKETFSKRKIGKRLVSVAMLSLAVAPIATPAVQVFAEDVAVVTTDSGTTATDEKSSPDTDAATDNSDAEKTAEMVARLENPKFATGFHFLYTRVYEGNPELEAGSENVKTKGYPTTMILGQADNAQLGISYRPQNEIVEVGTKPKETVLEETPFKTVRRETTDLPEGEERVVQEGVNSKTIEVETYSVKPNEIDWSHAQNAKSLTFVDQKSNNGLDENRDPAYYGKWDKSIGNYKLNEAKTGIDVSDTITLDLSEWKLKSDEVHHEDQITYDAYNYGFAPKADEKANEVRASILVPKQVSTNPFETSLSDTETELYYPYVHSYSGNATNLNNERYLGALTGADFGYTLESSKETKTIEGQDEIIEVGVAKKDFDDSKPVLPEQPSEVEEEVKEEAQKSVKTFWVDEDGKEIKASFIGDPQPAGDIEFYEFVETTTAENGDLTHHFKKVEKEEETPVTEEEVKEEETPAVEEDTQVTEEEVKEEETPATEEEVTEEETPTVEEETPATEEEEKPATEEEVTEEETPAEAEEVTEDTPTVEEETPQEETPVTKDAPAATEEAKDFSNKQPVQPEQPTQAAPAQPAQPAQQAAPQQSQPLPATGDDSNSAIALTFAGLTASILGLFGLAKQKKVD